MRIKSVNVMTHKIKLSMSAAAIIALSGCGGGSNTSTDIKAVDTSQPVSDWVMVWSDEFEGNSIDANKWTHEVNCAGGGNQEKQCYTDAAENSFVADGSLNIVAKPTDASSGLPLPYTSARMVTKYKGDWTYGRFEMRAKLPEGQGTWPAFWMLPTDEVYGGWPKSGEIDIMEAVNLKTDKGDGTPEDRIYGTLYYGRDFPNQSSSGQPFTPTSNPADGFNTYAIEWQEGEIRWYMNGFLYATQLASELRTNSTGVVTGLRHRGWFAEYFNIATGEKEVQWNSAPFDQDFHIILNLAVGGNWPEFVNELGIDETAFTDGQTYEIDYVRVYECAANPLTGAGCETIRAGYKDEEDALVIGKAPTPPPPPGSPPVPITIFDDEENEGWPLWASNEQTTLGVVSDDADRGNVAEFGILDNSGTVMGFNSRIAEDGMPYNGTAMVENGVLSFDMKIVTAPTSSTTWLLKVESDGGTNDGATGTDVELPLNSSIEGMDPVVGVWQTYSFSIAALQDGGLDPSQIDVMMIFPAWQTGEGAIYRIDNVRIEESGGTVFPELVLFEDQASTDWVLYACCGGNIPTEVMDDTEHGTVAEFSITDNSGVVLGFSSREDDGGSNMSFDATALLNEGVLEFEMKVESAPSDSSAVWLLKIESNGGGGNSQNGGTELEIPLNTSNEGVDPSSTWQTFTFDISDLSTAGLDVSAIDIIMVFPTWQKGDGAVYRIDNAKIYNPNASAGGPTGPTEVIFADQANPNWALWDCCGGTTPLTPVDDADRGTVAEFQINDNAGAVLGFNSRDGIGGGEAFDATALISTGNLSFKMKVESAPTDSSAVWLLKVESLGGTDNTNNGGTAVEVALNTSDEGADPSSSWQTFTFSLNDLTTAGLDVSAIDVIMIFPTWQKGAGAVYRVDDVVIGNPGGSSGSGGGSTAAALTMFADTVAPGWTLWDCCAGGTPTTPTDDAPYGTVAEFSVGAQDATVQGFMGRDNGTSFDATAIESSGKFQFDMKVVSAPNDSAADWLLKIEGGSDANFIQVSLNTSNEGQDPVVGQWQTYTFDILSFSGAGLNIDNMDVVMIFPTWELGEGAVYRVDNVVFTE